MWRHRNLLLLLLFSTWIVLVGCQTRVAQTAPTGLHEDQMAENAKKALAEAPTHLTNAYKQDREQKTWQSAQFVASILSNCLQNQQLLKDRGIEFEPVTSKKEALGWAELALTRASQPQKDQVPGARDPVESVNALISGIRRIPD